MRGRLLDALECPLGPLSRTESSANWPGRSGSDWATPPLACLQGIGSLWRSRTSKLGWLVFDVQRPRKAGGRRQALGPVCDLWSCLHGPGEDCDRFSSGTLGSCGFLRPGLGSLGLGGLSPRPFGARPHPIVRGHPAWQPSVTVVEAFSRWVSSFLRRPQEAVRLVVPRLGQGQGHTASRSSHSWLWIVGHSPEQHTKA